VKHLLPFKSQDAIAGGAADCSRNRAGSRSPTVVAKVPQHNTFP